MKNVHSKSLRTIALLLIIFAIQAIVCLYIAYQKQYLFTDEVYSYGLANSETTAFGRLLKRILGFGTYRSLGILVKNPLCMQAFKPVQVIMPL